MPIPFNGEQAFGTKARVAVRRTINGFAFRSIMPRGDGTHSMAMSKARQAGEQAKRPKIRAARIEKAIATIAGKKTPKG